MSEARHLLILIGIPAHRAGMLRIAALRAGGRDLLRAVIVPLRGNDLLLDQDRFTYLAMFARGKSRFGAGRID